MGQLLQFMMMEMIYLGFLLNVNPFDQPNVEDYKVETRKILLGN
jgi:glucose-6-phosphate isomerase